jgi:glycosyltransferase involved in cell wall biosynthesis
MLISLCIPCHNRAEDLKETLPTAILAAKNSEPVEILVLDYNSPDDLETYLTNLNDPHVNYLKYTGYPYYRMAHARNLSILSASGVYIIVSSCDILIQPEYFRVIRNLIETEQPVWMEPTRYNGVVVCQKDEFIRAGGFDERFTYYGQEDRDLADRLHRRGGKFIQCDGKLLGIIPTPNTKKLQNYDRPLSKRKSLDLMRPIYDENTQNGSLVANEGIAWGKW